MTINGAMTVGELVRLHPWVEEVLDGYGVDSSEDPMLTLDGLCWLHRLERGELLAQLERERTWRDVAVVPPPEEVFEEWVPAK